MGMRLDKYVNDVLASAPPGIRALRVEDISHGKDSWLVDDLIKGAMYVEDLHTNYFESEV